MADEKPSKDLPAATVVPQKPRGVMIDPTMIIAGGAVATIGITVLALFLWMVPSAAARESVSACRGMRGFERLNAALCPAGVPCELPIAAPDFTAVDHQGKPVKLSDFRGKVVLVNFWASWCAVCKTEKPSLAGMTSDLAGGDFEVISLASDKTWGAALVASITSLRPNAPVPSPNANGEYDMKVVLDAYRTALPDGIPYKVFLDPPEGDDTIGKIAQSWGIKAVPESALIDRKGNLRAYFVNKRDWESPVAQTCLRSIIDEE
ncbi:MAG: TlpA family protein disulfide reductase [Myxococcota bacterium]|nr:TlpA family protein disulfide reductase [Myxococcota bacterium]